MTYAQLEQTTPAELEAVFATSKRVGTYHFAEWIAGATELAKGFVGENAHNQPTQPVVLASQENVEQISLVKRLKKYTTVAV